MLQEETRGTIYLAIGAITAAITLSLIVFTLSSRNSFARTRSGEIGDRQRALQNMQLAKYDGEMVNGVYEGVKVSGVEVLSMIREYYNKSIDIYVDRDTFNSEWSKTTKRRVWNSSHTETQLALEQCGGYEYDYLVLSTLFNGKDKYCAYLYYDGRDVTEQADAHIHDDNSLVTGVRFVKE